MSPWPCLRAVEGGCLLDVAVVPSAKRTAADGLFDGALRVRLAAPPVDGKANQALVEWLADELGLARREVELIRGLASRRKMLRLAVDQAAVAAWLTLVVGAT